MLTGNGRHRRPRQAPALLVAAGVTGSAIALPLLGAASAHAADGTTWDKVAECESGGSWSQNSGNGYYGGLQISQDDWDKYGGAQYADSADQASRNQQIAVAEKILAAQGTKPWTMCALTAGLTSDSGSVDVDTGVGSSGNSGNGKGSGDDSGSTDNSDSSGLSDSSGADSGSGDGSGSRSGSDAGASSDAGATPGPSASDGNGRGRVRRTAPRGRTAISPTRVTRAARLVHPVPAVRPVPPAAGARRARTALRVPPLEPTSRTITDRVPVPGAWSTRGRSAVAGVTAAEARTKA
ncbi:transglycosylase family protein [Streptomyces lasalocidi]